jgi:hypothetical protein
VKVGEHEVEGSKSPIRTQGIAQDVHQVHAVRHSKDLVPILAQGRHEKVSERSVILSEQQSVRAKRKGRICGSDVPE